MVVVGRLRRVEHVPQHLSVTCAGNGTHLFALSVQIRHFRVVTPTRSIVIDRIAGRVRDQFAMANGGVITFDGTCKPVRSPSSERKF